MDTELSVEANQAAMDMLESLKATMVERVQHKLLPLCMKQKDVLLAVHRILHEYLSGEAPAPVKKPTAKKQKKKDRAGSMEFMHKEKTWL